MMSCFLLIALLITLHFYHQTLDITELTTWLGTELVKLKLYVLSPMHKHAGLQLGYFLHCAGSDYVIFEKNSIVG